MEPFATPLVLSHRHNIFKQENKKQRPGILARQTNSRGMEYHALASAQNGLTLKSTPSHTSLIDRVPVMPQSKPVTSRASAAALGSGVGPATVPPKPLTPRASASNLATSAGAAQRRSTSSTRSTASIEFAVVKERIPDPIHPGSTQPVIDERIFYDDCPTTKEWRLKGEVEFGAQVLRWQQQTGGKLAKVDKGDMARITMKHSTPTNYTWVVRKQDAIIYKKLKAGGSFVPPLPDKLGAFSRMFRRGKKNQAGS